MMDLGKQHVKSLKSAAHIWAGVVVKEWKKVRPNAFVKAFKYEDELRLLTLRVWVQKYRVTLLFIIETLVPYYIAGSNKSKRVPETSLGVTAATLCGDKSEQILVEAIQRTYPNRENVSEWRAKEQQRYLGRFDMPNLNAAKPKEYVQKYRATIQRNRDEVKTITESGVFKRRRFPDNPWI